MFTVRPIRRFGLPYFGVFYNNTLLCSMMSETGAKQRVTQLERKVQIMRTETVPL